MSTASTIIGIDNGTEKGYDRRLFVSSLTGFVKRLAKNGQHSHVIKALDLIKELNEKNEKPLISENNGI